MAAQTTFRYGPTALGSGCDCFDLAFLHLEPINRARYVQRAREMYSSMAVSGEEGSAELVR
jgi:hypothetical protein